MLYTYTVEIDSITNRAYVTKAAGDAEHLIGNSSLDLENIKSASIALGSLIINDVKEEIENEVIQK